MQGKQLSLKASLCVAGTLALSNTAFAATKYSALDITPAGTTGCTAWAINARAQVVGSATLAQGQGTRGFITGPNGNNPKLIGTLGGNSSQLMGLNDLGQAVGDATLADGTTHAILVEPDGTSAIDIGTLGGNYSTATAINAKGRIIGQTTKAGSDRLFGFVTSGASHKMAELGPDMYPRAINAKGVVAGSILGENKVDGFITGPGADGLTLLGTLGGTATWAWGLNKSGMVVGLSARDDQISNPAFVTDAGGGNLRSLGIPGPLSLAMSINNQGRIVGYYDLDFGGPSRAFIARATGGYKDLNTQVSLPGGAQLSTAASINDKGQIAAHADNKRCYLLTPLTR